ncbi:MAG: hypothetical protein ACOY3Z_08510 [Thermodesulfobacteriota bacterium]
MAPTVASPSGIFSPAMHAAYELAVRQVRIKLLAGQSYNQACDTLVDLDQEMRDFVRNDFLKILIAEEHFGAGADISDIALLLGLPYEEVEASVLALLHDMVQEAEIHRQSQLGVPRLQ